MHISNFKLSFDETVTSQIYSLQLFTDTFMIQYTLQIYCTWLYYLTHIVISVGAVYNCSHNDLPSY